jgi:phage gp29-like protein
MGIIKGLTPGGGDTEDKARFGSALRNLGAEPTIVCPQGENGAPGFDVEVVEAKGEGWQIFGDREKGLNTNIAVRVLGQNLTTEVSGTGSLAAGKVHEMVRGDIKRSDARFYAKLRDQVLTWWTGYNYGDPELAPYPKAQIVQPAEPIDDAKELLTVVTAIAAAPPELDVTAIMEAHGFPILEGDELAARLQRMRALMPVAPASGSPGAGTPQASEQGADGTPPAAASDTSPTGLTAVRALSDFVSLSAGTGAARRRAKYQDVQAQRATRVASKTLRPFIAKVLAAVDSATSFEDMRRLIVAEARHRGADVAGLEKLVAQVNMLARLHGREAALATVIK